MLEWLFFMILVFFVILVPVLVLASVRIVRPTHRAIIERLGKYNRFSQPGLSFVIPLIERMFQINVTEKLVDLERQEVITGDNLNAFVDAQVYFKVRTDEDSVKKSTYAVNDFEFQIVNLARTTLRDVIGNLSLKDVNSQRNKINIILQQTLKTEAINWGVDIVRTELKEITPPADVQDTMNLIVKAENEKIAAINFATAVETRADGEKRAAIKKAQGYAEAIRIEAQANADKIKLVNESAQKYFKGDAQILKKLETVEATLKDNAKIVLPESQSLVNVIDSMAGIVPLKENKK